MRKTWDETSIAEAAKGYSTRKAFYEGNRSAYAAASRRGILDAVCTHMPANTARNGQPRLTWDRDSALSEALKYDTRGALAQGSPGAYGWLNRNHLLEEACAHMPDHAATKWTKAALQEEAKKYANSAEFRHGNRSAWVTAHRLKIMEELEYVDA